MIINCASIKIFWKFWSVLKIAISRLLKPKLNDVIAQLKMYLHVKFQKEWSSLALFWADWIYIPVHSLVYSAPQQANELQQQTRNLVQYMQWLQNLATLVWYICNCSLNHDIDHWWLTTITNWLSLGAIDSKSLASCQRWLYIKSCHWSLCSRSCVELSICKPRKARFSSICSVLIGELQRLFWVKIFQFNWTEHAFVCLPVWLGSTIPYCRWH